jgi:hypothetical protein
MMEKPICMCYLCREWFIEESMEEVMVPDQSGHVKKLACLQCIRGVVERSSK